MDYTAQNQVNTPVANNPAPQPVSQVPSTAEASASPAPQQPQPKVSTTDPSASGGDQPLAVEQDQAVVVNVPQQPAPAPSAPTEQPVGKHPEHAPVTTPPPTGEVTVAGPDTISDASDVADIASPSASDAVAEANATDAQQVSEATVKESQPAVEVPHELQEVGIEQGEDAKQERPEEQQKVDVTLPKEQPSNAYVMGPQPLPMDYPQAVATQKSSKIRDSIKWLATLIKYQWEQLQAKGDKT